MADSTAMTYHASDGLRVLSRARGSAMKATPTRSRRQVAVIVLLVLLVAYVTSYFVLSRRGMRANQALGADGFGYFAPAVGRLPVEACERLLMFEGVLHVVYWPIYTFDYHVLGGPCHSPLHAPM